MNGVKGKSLSKSRTSCIFQCIRILTRAFGLLAIFVVCIQVFKVSVSGQSSAVDNVKLPRGILLEKVIIESQPQQSYATYLPRNYDSQKRWAIIYCFDPLAQGANAVKHFQEAAEKYGFIIVCSNNSRNGLEPNELQKILTVFFEDVGKRFNIDEKRSYAAGFSGGARLAVGLAISCGQCMAGVIGVGAGFPLNVRPSEENSFIYFGSMGIDDFNFGEMRALENLFRATPTAIYRFDTFEGGHEWIDKKTSLAALAWINLQAMKKGTLERDNNFIEEQFNLRKLLAEHLASKGNLIEAHQNYLSMIRDFEGLLDIQALKDKTEQLSNSAQLKKQIKSENELIKRQESLAYEIVSLQNQKVDASDGIVNPKIQLRDKLADWRKKSSENADSGERRLARRLLFRLFIGAVEFADAELRRKNYSQAIRQLDFAMLIYPQNFNIVYQKARIYALNKQKKDALEMLEKAIELGFKNIEQIKSDEAFLTISQEPRFQKLFSENK